MTHVRTLIRDQFRDALDGALPPGYVVFGRRVYARNRTEGDATISVVQGDVEVTQETMGDDRTCVGEVMVRVGRSAPADTLHDVLDEDEVQVTLALANNADWAGLVEEMPELVAVRFATPEADGEKVVGGMLMTYRVEYRVAWDDPETVRN